MRGIKFRLDIDHPRSAKPVLLNLWIEGFGWIKGGARAGDVMITGVLDSENPNSEARRFIRRTTKLEFGHKADWM